MYQIRKGWPSQAAVDEVLYAAPGETVTDGMLVTVADGKAKKADNPAEDDLVAFIIGYENVRGTHTGIMSQVVIEIDADMYEAGSYAAGDKLGAKDGKFAKGCTKTIGRVLSFDGTTGLMRLLFHEAH